MFDTGYVFPGVSKQYYHAASTQRGLLQRMATAVWVPMAGPKVPAALGLAWLRYVDIPTGYALQGIVSLPHRIGAPASQSHKIPAQGAEVLHASQQTKTVLERLWSKWQF